VVGIPGSIGCAAESKDDHIHAARVHAKEMVVPLHHPIAVAD
jgi:hypothetical protein